jgi:hypothetical protein
MFSQCCMMCHRLNPMIPGELIRRNPRPNIYDRETAQSFPGHRPSPHRQLPRPILTAAARSSRPSLPIVSASCIPARRARSHLRSLTLNHHAPRRWMQQDRLPPPHGGRRRRHDLDAPNRLNSKPVLMLWTLTFVNLPPQPSPSPTTSNPASVSQSSMSAVALGGSIYRSHFICSLFSKKMQLFVMGADLHLQGVFD